MWEISSTRSGDLVRTTLTRDGQAATVGDVVAGWRADRGFRVAFNDALAVIPFPAFRWETPVVTVGTLGDPFECVVLDAPELRHRRADPSAFAEPLRRHPGSDVAVFPNLSGDCRMVVPRPLGPDACYGDLAAFVRGAPGEQRQAVWSAIGAAIEARLADRPNAPVWLSTAGAGVPWLHVRLDDRPKYYHHQPYRAVPD